MNFFNRKNLRGLKFLCFITLAASFFSCNKDEIYLNLPIYGPSQLFYALADQNVIITYNAKDVRNEGTRVNVSGLAASELLLAIDFRPATGELYGITNQNNLYVVDIPAGNTKLISTTPISPALSGAPSIDFDPTSDRIRLVSTSGQNLRINPENGAADNIGSNLTNASVSGIAHSNSYAGASTTILYDIDPSANRLYKQDPNAGTLTNVGNLEVTLGNNVSFDISPDNLKALAVGKLGDSTRLFTINLSTGKASLAGKFALGTTIRSIAIPADPAAYAVDQTNNILIFNPNAKIPTLYSRPITGLQTGETIYGIDMRTANGSLYALGSSNRLYTINTATGVANQVALLSTALNGTGFGFDFNPLTDLIRVVSDTRQNLSVNPITGLVTVNTSLTPASATISAAAYINNFRTASSTVLYVIDHTTDKVYRQEPNSGVLTELGELKINVTAVNGFDSVYSNGGDIAMGIFTVGAKTGVYQISLTSGEATLLYDFSKPVTAFALGLKF